MGKQQGISEELVAHLDEYHSGPFTEREKMALRYAEILALAPQSLDEAFCERLYAHFTPAQVVHLGIAVAFLFGWGRFVAAFRIPVQSEQQG